MKEHETLSTYAWQGITREGKKLSGEIIAATLGRAQNNLIRHQIHIISLKKKKSLKRRFYYKMRTETQIIFFTQLAALLQSGLPLLSAIDIVCRHEKNPALTLLQKTLRDNILAGKGLASGLLQFPHYFNAMTCHLVRAGEKTARLDSLLERIANHLKKMNELRRKIIRACFYPTLTLLFASIIAILLLAIMTPRFAKMFQEMHIPLPALTRGVMAIGETLRQMLLPSIGLIGVVACLIWTYCDTAWYQQRRDWLNLRLPLMGDIIKKIILARIARTLATLLSAGLPMTDALGMMIPIAGNHYYASAIQQLQSAILIGKPLHQAMRENSLFPEVMQQMVKAGEESSTLVNMLEKTAEFYETGVDHTAALIAEMLEPLIMLILGVVIGALVIAMYLPIFRLGNAI